LVLVAVGTDVFSGWTVTVPMVRAAVHATALAPVNRITTPRVGEPPALSGRLLRGRCYQHVKNL
jgi:hypothetical protein